MIGSTVRAHAFPALALAVVVVLDLALGRDQVLAGLTVVSPMVAATVLRRRTTARYGVTALICAALLGLIEDQYAPGALAAQLTRLVLIAVGAGAAVVACGLRQERERATAELAAEHAAERAATRAVLEVAEMLQRSLLVQPPPLPRLTTAVRYRAATREAAIGGDWYDVFAVPDGTTMLVIGDVTGHDARAAATMAQARGLLRGLAQSVVGSPAAVLTALDRALTDLHLDVLATVVVATVDTRDDDGPVLLRWSNAGHPPPILISAAGGTTLLERPVDPLLGLDLDRRRSDHEQQLTAGDGLVLYTDGLVEHRGRSLDDGTAALLARLDGSPARSLGEVCDDLLTTLGGREDDVALLAVRIDR